MLRVTGWHGQVERCATVYAVRRYIAQVGVDPYARAPVEPLRLRTVPLDDREATVATPGLGRAGRHRATLASHGPLSLGLKLPWRTTFRMMANMRSVESSSFQSKFSGSSK